MSELVACERYGLTDFYKDKAVFLAYLRLKGRRENTISTYDEALKSIYRTMCNIGLDGNVRTLSGDDIIQIKEAMTVKETSKKLYLIVLGRMAECLGYVNPYKSADILWNRTEPRRAFITREDFKHMMNLCNDRDRLALMFGAYMGLRRSEIVGIRLSDIKGNTLRVSGKGHGQGKEASLRIPKSLLRAIDSFLVTRTVSDYLLVSEDGRRLSNDMLGSLIERLSKKLGISATCHSLRRLFATTMYDCGVDLNTIKNLMRHEDLSTTLSCYIQANPVHQDRALDMVCEMLD